MDDYNIPQLINALLSVVKTMNERLGVPTDNTGAPATVIGVDPSAVEANVWGSELQVGKYFPNDTQASFLKPLFTGLDSLFVRFFSNMLPTGTKFTGPTVTPLSNIGVEQLLGFDSEALVKLSTNLGLAVPGLVLFKDLDWDFVSISIEYLDDMFVDLSSMNEESFTSLETGNNVLALSKTLALAIPGFVALTAVNWKLVQSAVKPIMSVLSTLTGFGGAILSNGADLLTKFAVAIGAVGLALIPITLGLNGFAAISWETLLKAGVVIGVLVAGLVALGTIGLAAAGPTAIALGILGLGIAAFGLLVAGTVYVASLALTEFGDSILGVAEAVSLGITTFGNALRGIAELPLANLPEQGKAIGKFFTNIVSDIGFWSGGKLAGFIASLPKLSAGLTGLGNTIKQLAPVLPGLETFLQGFINTDTSKIRIVSNELVASFTPMAASINSIGEAIDSISFAKLSLLATNLGKVAIKVNTFGPEMEKTNTVLAEQLDIQKQQLVELKNQTMLLSKLKIGDTAQQISQPQSQQTPTTPSFFDSTRQNYQNSAYYAKSK
jgi:hypothetical protein